MALKLVNALARQRVLAEVIDVLPPVMALAAAQLLDGASTAWWAAAGFVLAYWVAVSVWEARTGRTPGNLVVGLVTVSRTGGAPGLVTVLVRALVLGASSLVPVIGPFVVLISNIWDRNGRRRGWHDKAVGTYVLDVRAGRDPLKTGGLDGGLDDGRVNTGAGRPAAGSIGGGVPPRAAPVSAVADRVSADGTGSRSAAPVGAAFSEATATANDSANTTAADAASGTADGEKRTLRFDDGTEVAVSGQVLIGHDPELRPNEAADYLINFSDPTRSVSGTHLHLTLGSGAVWVTDRGSITGSSLVDPAGTEQPLHPELPMMVPAGYSVRFGDRRLTVS